MTVISRGEKLGTWIEGNPIIILTIAVLLTVASIHYAQNIEMETETDTFVDENTRLYQEYTHLYEDKFGTESIVVLVEGDAVTRPEALEAMNRFITHMDTVNHVLGTHSIAEMVMDAEARETGVRRIPGSQERIDEILESIDPVFRSMLLPDERHTMIVIDMPMYISYEDLMKVLPDVETAVEMADFPPGADTIVTGEVALGTAIQYEMNSSMGRLLAVSVLFMVLALLLVFRHVHLSLLPLPIVLLGIIWTFGMMGFLQVPLTMVSMAAFPILIGLGIDYAIQFHNRIEEEFQQGESAATAVCDTVAHTAPAVLIALTITGAGFFSLFTSSVPMIRDFGLLCLIGIVMCYLSALFVGVTILYQMEKGRIVNGETKSERRSAIAPLIEKSTMFFIHRWRTVLATALILSLVGMYADSQVPIETDFKEYIPQDLPPLIQFQHLHNIFGGTDEINIIVQADDVTDPEMLRWMDEFGNYLTESREQVYGVTSLATLVKMYNNGEIPDDQSRVEAVLDTIPDDTKYSYVDGHNTAHINVNIGEAVRDLAQVGIKRLVGEIDKDITWFEPPPGTSVTQTGGVVVMITVIDALTTGRMRMTFLGLVLIFILLLVIYRDPIKAVLPILPMIVVIGWMGGVMYITGMVYTPLTATLGALILGIGSEYAVLTMERFYEEKAKTTDNIKALKIAIGSIGAAIFASGLTTVFGFSALMASPFPMNSNFGTVTVLSVIFALFVTFTVFPVLLIRLEYWRDKRDAAKSDA
ncbi:MAG: hydrophobe/amphiphile efflux-3 (HAE3) family transporter [Methanotrichaceae archaeon]